MQWMWTALCGYHYHSHVNWWSKTNQTNWNGKFSILMAYLEKCWNKTTQIIWRVVMIEKLYSRRKYRSCSRARSLSLSLSWFVLLTPTQYHWKKDTAQILFNEHCAVHIASSGIKNRVYWTLIQYRKRQKIFLHANIERNLIRCSIKLEKHRVFSMHPNKVNWNAIDVLCTSRSIEFARLS